MSVAKRYSPAFVFAVFAVLAGAGWEGLAFRVALLTCAAVALVVAERERRRCV